MSWLPRHRLRSLIKRSALGALLMSMSYQVDADGLRTQIQESDASGPVRSVYYAYDAAKRLVREQIDHRLDLQDRHSTWAYDRVGNRLQQSQTEGSAAATVTDYVYDSNDRLQSETTDGVRSNYTYDANGNTLTKATPQGSTAYEYDDANRLITATTPDGLTEYVYNADGLRVRQTHAPSAGAPTTTWYLQDSAYPYAQVIEEHQGATVAQKRLTATFAFADDLVSQTRYSETGIPSTRFVQMDGFGSTRWLTDANGNVIDSIDYDAFGVEIGRTSTTAINHRCRGEVFDEQLGLYYLRARWMDPRLGRFTQMDGFAGFATSPLSLHRYAYAHSNPVLYSDPSGYMVLLGLDLGGDVHQLGQDHWRQHGAHNCESCRREGAGKIRGKSASAICRAAWGADTSTGLLQRPWRRSLCGCRGQARQPVRSN